MSTVTIITVCRNAEKTIEKTIQSVLAQTYSNIEYIIIDGQSSDGTLQILNKYRERISTLVSEADGGIYDAMNKGISLAKGDILYFLNADDWLYDETVISKIIEEFKRSNVLLVYGKCIYENIPSKMVEWYRHRKFVFKRKLDVAKHVAPQQCFFYHKKAVDIIGNFNPDFKIAADMDWFLKFMNHKLPMSFIDQHICYCSLGGTSSNAHINERINVFRNNMNIYEFTQYAIFALIRQLLRRLKGRRVI